MKKTLIAAVAACASLVAVNQAAASETRTITPSPTPLLVMVTSSDAQVQLMSMVLTMQSAKQGANARVLLCGEAGDMALRDAPASATAPQPPKSMSPQGLMKMVMANTNTQVEVCAIYLPGKGLDSSALIDGVGVADPADIASAMTNRYTQIASF